MPEALVRNVRINYEVAGSRGPWIALTPGSRRAFAELVPLAETLANEGYRILLHDRRNCGSSEIAIEALGSEHDVWADDLHELAQQLGALPLYVGGSSAGARLSILFALRHPRSTGGLLLWRVTGGSAATEELAEIYYGSFIKIAQAGGMAAVCESDHFRACISARPSNRAKLMAMKPEQFIGVMTAWRERFLESANMPIIGATEDQIRGITQPVCIIAGNDRIHAPTTARRMHNLLPNSEFHDDVVEKFPDDKLLSEWNPSEWKAKEPLMAQIFASFLKQAKHIRAPRSPS